MFSVLIIDVLSFLNWPNQLPLADPKETAAQQGDVVHYGIQENTTEALIYSGVFVEDVAGGINVGYGQTTPRIH